MTLKQIKVPKKKCFVCFVCFVSYLCSDVPRRFAESLVAVDDRKIDDLCVGKDETAVGWKTKKRKSFSVTKAKNRNSFLKIWSHFSGNKSCSWGEQSSYDIFKSTFFFRSTLSLSDFYQISILLLCWNFSKTADQFTFST